MKPKPKRVDEVVFVAVTRSGTVAYSTVSLTRFGPLAIMRERSPFATTHDHRVAMCRLVEIKKGKKP